MLSREVGVLEGQSGWIQFTILDEDGVPVPKFRVDTFTLDLYNEADLSTVNDRAAQDVLDVNGGALDDLTGVFRWTYSGADTPFSGSDTCRTTSTRIRAAASQTETHIASFRWTWDSGTKSYGVEIKMNVRNVRRYQVA